MIWLLTRPLVLIFRLAFGTTKLTTKATSGSFKLGYRAGRLVGFRCMAGMAVGVGIGILMAPRTGAQSRAALRRWYDEVAGKPTTVAPLLDAPVANHGPERIPAI